jgi:hypothetical protein
LPGDFIAIGVKWANLSAATGERALILNSILYNKLVLLVPPLLFGSVALTLENPFPEAAIGVSVIFLAILIFFMIFCLFSYRFGVLINRLFAKIIKLLPTFFQSKIAGLTNSLEMLRGLSFLDHSIILLISIISYVLSIIFFILGAKTIGLNVPISALIWIYSIIVFFVHLPITIGNLGVRESILITTLLNYGILPEKSFSFGLILFTNHILIALIGSGYQVALNLGWTRWKLIN